MEPITLARMVDRLEAAGFVERRFDPSDRRLKRLHLQEAAAPVLDQMRELGAATREEALAGVTDADRERVIDVLLAMKTNLLGLEPTSDPVEDPVEEQAVEERGAADA